MTITADVAIIGAGVTGWSVAFHLARLGCTNIVVLDRAGEVAAGSTARATGGFRVQFGSEINVRLSLLSRAKLLDFEAETGVASGYVEAGYLFLADDDAQLRALHDIQSLLRAHGVDAMSIVDEADVARLNPAVAEGTHRGGSFCSIDGFIRPLAIADGYAQAAQRMGVRFLHSAPVSSGVFGSARIESVRAGDHDVHANLFVNAAGAWAGAVAATLCTNAEVRPLRRMVLPTEKTDLLPASMPMTIWLSDGFHLRVRDGRVLLLQPDDNESGFDDRVEDAWVERVERLARQRVPSLRDVAVARDRAWGGLYEMTPDHHAIVGRDARFENLWIASGSSGHGVMHAPAIGQLLAESMLGIATAVDLHSLRPTRFVENDPVRGIDLL